MPPEESRCESESEVDWGLLQRYGTSLHIIVVIIVVIVIWASV